MIRVNKPYYELYGSDLLGLVYLLLGLARSLEIAKILS